MINGFDLTFINIAFKQLMSQKKNVWSFSDKLENIKNNKFNEKVNKLTTIFILSPTRSKLYWLANVLLILQPDLNC